MAIIILSYTSWLSRDKGYILVCRVALSTTDSFLNNTNDSPNSFKVSLMSFLISLYICMYLSVCQFPFSPSPLPIFFLSLSICLLFPSPQLLFLFFLFHFIFLSISFSSSSLFCLISLLRYAARDR